MYIFMLIGDLYLLVTFNVLKGLTNNKHFENSLNYCQNNIVLK